MESLSRVLALSTEYFTQKGIVNARRQAEEMLCDLLGVGRLQLYTDFERPLNEHELSECRQRMKRRIQGEPLQYIHGQVQFYNCVFNVSPSVLIPRQETEILVDKIVKALKGHDLKGKVLWDLCSGSGCIGIALKKQFPDLDVILGDLSPDALKVAEENAQLNQVNVTLRHGDLFAAFGQDKADLIVCNPPYVSEVEYGELDKEVHAYEPRMALVGGETGLEFYERLADALPHHLRSPGMAWLELGKGQGKQLEALFKNPFWKTRKLEQDWAGHDRFFFLENE